MTISMVTSCPNNWFPSGLCFFTGTISHKFLFWFSYLLVKHIINSVGINRELPTLSPNKFCSRIFKSGMPVNWFGVRMGRKGDERILLNIARDWTVWRGGTTLLMADFPSHLHVNAIVRTTTQASWLNSMFFPLY